MQIDLVAERKHYRDHLLPIWNALPSEAKGTDWGVGPSRGSNVLLVAGYSDVKRHPHHQCVYVEHGAGQSYVGLPAEVAPFYSPLVRTKQHRNVIAFICPNDEVASRWARSYDRPTFVVGCPKLDPWHAGLRGKPEPRTVAITFHWEPPASVWTHVPELRSCFDIYWRVISESIANWRNQGWQVLAHAHPRAHNVIQFWQREMTQQCEFVHESADILDRASILIADNTSLSAEFMSLGRGVVWLNHLAYRRDVDHGGRFWKWPSEAGTTINAPTELPQLCLDGVPPSLWHPYAHVDGHTAERAAQAILSLL